MTPTISALLTMTIVGGGIAVLAYTIDTALQERARRKERERAERARQKRAQQKQTEAEKEMRRQIARNRDALWAEYVQEVRADGQSEEAAGKTA